MAIRRLAPGRYQADYSNARDGIPRTKRTFATRRQAQEWLAAVQNDAHARLLGKRQRHLFGQALNRYLTEYSPHKRTHQDDLDNLAALRWPYWDATAHAWRTLEHAPLTDAPDGIVAALAAWTTEQRAVIARRHLHGTPYHQRRTAAGTCWYSQPSPGPDGTPRPRQPVTDPKITAQLDATPGRGPYSPSTIRIRQALVRRVLTIAHREWRLTETDLANLITLERPGTAREHYLTPDQLTALIIALPPHLDDAALGAAWIGWRRSNILGRYTPRKGRDIPGLAWDRVAFPVYQGSSLIQPGYIWYTADDAKNAADHYTPTSTRVEALLRHRWDLRRGPLVFHDGTGRPFGDFRKTWKTALIKSGNNPNLRWHDLRHTWASELVQAGATDRQIQELGGWKDAKMPQRYAHLRKEHLIEIVNRPGRIG